MLVLTRKLNEQICIGDNITITVLRIKGNAVRVGIQAPRDVRVVRGELPTFDAGDLPGEKPATHETNSETMAAEEPDEAPLAAFRPTRCRRRKVLAEAKLLAS